MTPYFVYFSIPLIIYIYKSIGNISDNDFKIFLLKNLFFIITIIFVGFRYEVGGDWLTYLIYIEDNVFTSLLQTLKYDRTNLYSFTSEPGWAILTWISQELRLGIIGINLFSSLLFFVPLIILLNKSKDFWLSVIICVPYLIIIVSMGYIRQSIALGFFMIALSKILENRKNKAFYFMFYIIIGATFHRSLFVMLPFIFFLNNKIFSLKNFFLGLVIILFILFYFKDIFLGSMYTNYIKERISMGMHSGGAVPRIIMNFIPAVIYILIYNKIKKDDRNLVFFAMSIFTIFCLIFVSFGTTAIDRISLYLMPVQFILWPIIINNFNDETAKFLIRFSLIFVYFMSLLIWMNFATTKRGWLPYKSVLTENYLVLQKGSTFGINDTQTYGINEYK